MLGRKIGTVSRAGELDRIDFFQISESVRMSSEVDLQAFQVCQFEQQMQIFRKRRVFFFGQVDFTSPVHNLINERMLLFHFRHLIVERDVFLIVAL